MRVDKKVLVLGGAALVAATFAASMASAQAQQTQQTPRNWSYEIKDGKRVPKGNRVTKPDGSWREEVRQGNCVTIKEGTPDGAVKTTRKCD